MSLILRKHYFLVGCSGDSLGADPAIIGRTLDINNQPMRVIGVLPANFRSFQMSNPSEVPRVLRPLTDHAKNSPAFGKLGCFR